MSFLGDVKRKIEIARIRKENAEFAKKFGSDSPKKIVPALFTGSLSDEEIVKEITGAHTKEIIAYETKSGKWILANTDYGKAFTGSGTIQSPMTKEYEAAEALNYPRWNG